MNYDFTAGWAWPQWAYVALLLLALMQHISRHGQPKLQTSGDEAGQPQRYNAFGAMLATGIIVSVLICGGFFAHG